MPSIKFKDKTYGSATFPVLEMTKAEYDALPVSKQNDGTVYMITDDDGGWEAERCTYDNTASGLTATNVQDVIDELYSKTAGPYLKTGDFINQTYTEQYAVGTSVINWSIYGAKAGYTAKSFTFFHSNCTTVKAGVEGASLSNGSFTISGFAKTIDGSTAPTTNFWVQILWVKNV